MAQTRARRNGYFVEIGAFDGMFYSNTYYLEKVLGWDGVLIEPSLSASTRAKRFRSCPIITSIVGANEGESEIQTHAGLLGMWNGLRGVGPAALRSSQSTYTQTLTSLLKSVGAPSRIDFISVDVEGGEVDVLMSLNHGAYRASLWCIEHNHDARQRRAVRDIMEAEGYLHTKSVAVDDYYVDPSTLCTNHFGSAS